MGLFCECKYTEKGFIYYIFLKLALKPIELLKRDKKIIISVQLIFRKIQYPTSSGPPVQHMCSKLYVKPSGCTARANLIPLVLYTKALGKPCRDVAKGKMKPLFQEASSYLAIPLTLKKLEDLMKENELVQRLHLFQRKHRTAVWCHKQTDRPLLQQLLKQQHRL